MHILASQYFWWASGSCLYTILAVTMLVKRSFRTIPAFNAWIDVALLQPCTLYVLYRLASRNVYTVVYWVFAVLEILLQVAVVVEFADRALRHRGSWPVGTRPLFTVGSGAALLLASSLSLLAKAATNIPRDVYYTRFELFSSILVFLLAVETFAISYGTGSLWKSADLYRFGGFLVWSAAFAAADTLHVYWRTIGYFTALENFHIAVTQGTVIYWIVTMLYPVGKWVNSSTFEVQTLSTLYKAD